MSVFELAGLASLRRLSLVRVQKLTDIGIFAIAEHAVALERLHMDYCDNLSLDAIHLVLKSLEHLQHLTVTGIPSFKRKGIRRFSDPPPPVSNSKPVRTTLTLVLSELERGSASCLLCVRRPKCEGVNALSQQGRVTA